MSFEIVLRREAQIDLDEIFIWYEEQKVGLGFEFLKEFENAINKVSHNPHYASYSALYAKRFAGEEHPAFRFALVIYILNILLLLLPFVLVLFLC